MSSWINIVFITDKNFVPQTHVAIMSLIDTKNIDTKYQIYICAKQISEEQCKNFKNLEIENVKIEVINNEDISIKGLTGVIPIVYWRLKLPEIIPNCDKILHLDCDIVVKKDLSNLYNIEVNNYDIAAVKDITPVLYNENKKYFNAGIMLLNLKKIRQDGLFEKAINLLIKGDNKYTFLEQDVLNEIIGDKLKLISPRYNFITSYRRYTKKQLYNYFGEYISDKDIIILHYAGKCRPWMYTNVYFAKDWEVYYKKSPYSNQKLERKFIPFFTLWVNIIYQYKIFKNPEIYRNVGLLK